MSTVFDAEDVVTADCPHCGKQVKADVTAGWSNKDEIVLEVECQECRGDFFVRWLNV